ncbi:MAG: AAA family ATPase [Caulobacterales bacterium]
MTTNPANPSEAWKPELDDESAMVEFEPLQGAEAPPFLNTADDVEAEEEAEEILETAETVDFSSLEGISVEEEPLADAPPPFELLESGGMSAVLEASAVSALMDLPEPRGADGALLGDITLPRISIHAFIENVTTAQMLQAAASDRRLAKAAFNVTMGGIPAAILHLGAQQSANLIVVESVAPAAKLLADLDHLAEFCDANTKVIVIGQQNDIALYRELMRRGVSEYLVPPMHPLHFIRAAANLYGDATAPFVGRSIAFVGAKGGVGSSTICHNIAWSMANRVEVNTTLVDLDLSFGTSGLDFNQDATQGVAEALASPDRVDDVVLDRLLTRCSEHLTLFSAPASVDRSFEFPSAAYQIVIERVRRAVPYVVLDLPHVWAPWVRQSLSDADDVVIVCTPDLSCLRNAKNLLDVLRTARANDAPPKVILNMVGVPKRPEIPVKDFGEALGIAPILVLPFEAQIFAQAANNGQMLAEVGPQSKTVEGIEYLAAHLTGRAAPAKRTGLLSKLSLAKR